MANDRGGVLIGDVVAIVVLVVGGVIGGFLIRARHRSGDGLSPQERYRRFDRSDR